MKLPSAPVETFAPQNTLTSSCSQFLDTLATPLGSPQMLNGSIEVLVKDNVYPSTGSKFEFPAGLAINEFHVVLFKNPSPSTSCTPCKSLVWPWAGASDPILQATHWEADPPFWQTVQGSNGTSLEIAPLRFVLYRGTTPEAPGYVVSPGGGYLDPTNISCPSYPPGLRGCFGLMGRYDTAPPPTMAGGKISLGTSSKYWPYFRITGAPSSLSSFFTSKLASNAQKFSITLPSIKPIYGIVFQISSSSYSKLELAIDEKTPISSSTYPTNSWLYFNIQTAPYTPPSTSLSLLFGGFSAPPPAGTPFQVLTTQPSVRHTGHMVPAIKPTYSNYDPDSPFCRFLDGSAAAYGSTGSKGELIYSNVCAPLSGQTPSSTTCIDGPYYPNAPTGTISIFKDPTKVTKQLNTAPSPRSTQMDSLRLRCSTDTDCSGGTENTCCTGANVASGQGQCFSPATETCAVTSTGQTIVSDAQYIMPDTPFDATNASYIDVQFAPKGVPCEDPKSLCYSCAAGLDAQACYLDLIGSANEWNGSAPSRPMCPFGSDLKLWPGSTPQASGTQGAGSAKLSCLVATQCTTDIDCGSKGHCSGYQCVCGGSNDYTCPADTECIDGSCYVACGEGYTPGFGGCVRRAPVNGVFNESYAPDQFCNQNSDGFCTETSSFSDLQDHAKDNGYVASCVGLPSNFDKSWGPNGFESSSPTAHPGCSYPAISYGPHKEYYFSQVCLPVFKDAPGVKAPGKGDGYYTPGKMYAPTDINLPVCTQAQCTPPEALYWKNCQCNNAEAVTSDPTISGNFAEQGCREIGVGIPTL